MADLFRFSIGDPIINLYNISHMNPQNQNGVNNTGNQFNQYTAPNVQSNVSQTGVNAQPIQVENVQYNVNAADYESKPSLAFGIAKTTLAIILFASASLLFTLTGKLFSFIEEVSTAAIVVPLSFMIVLLPIFYISQKRLNKIIENPVMLEEMKFKQKLRRSFISFLVLGAIVLFISVVNILTSIVESDYGIDFIQNTFFSLYFGGGLVLMCLWLYRYQKQTAR
jgi:hypothetical protein